jgi:hypothetical protein
VNSKQIQQVRPKLEFPVAAEFRDYCREQGLVMNFAATKAIAKWLQEEKKKAIAPYQ